MSRIGKQPVAVPKGVKVALEDGQIHVEGPKGNLSFRYHPAVGLTFDAADGKVRVTRSDDQRLSRSLHGLTRALVANMIRGVTEGFQKKLEVVGIGYQASLKGKALQVQVGWAQPLTVEPPAGITFEVPDPTHIVVAGVDRQLVGQVAADIRRQRPPEPYKGKGIRYQGEVVRRKAGKAFAGGAAT
ncbi:MAG: 50S ribosomal protein L6 [Planctomycetes bacterium]|nr:50S ribosomal protein L6 [Planctomycetota bacterium]